MEALIHQAAEPSSCFCACCDDGGRLGWCDLTGEQVGQCGCRHNVQGCDLNNPAVKVRPLTQLLYGRGRANFIFIVSALKRASIPKALSQPAHLNMQALSQSGATTCLPCRFAWMAFSVAADPATYARGREDAITRIYKSVLLSP
eukprot:1146423-Pelagomonas_calceolata.AAC.3